MNEFTIERKAKAYDEAIKRAKALYDNDQPISGSNVIINNIFPELKESDDEGIRKGIIHNLKYLANKAQGFVKDELEERIAWLEKQVSVDEEKVLIGARKDIALSIMNFFNKNTLGMGLSNMECEDLEDAVVNSDWLKVYRYMKKKLEKQVEQKQDPCEHCDNVMLNCQNFPCIKKRAFEQGKSILEVINEEKVEPKYHEGDWVVSPNGVYWHIDRISNNRYEVTSNTGESSNWNLDTNIYHRFTIQDAKDGDVLVDAYGNIGIFEKRYGINWHTYCYLGNEGRFISEGGSHGSICYPATKEERDTLFTKMKEAGYTFNFEKKELKLLITNGGDFETENCEQKPAWSEKDELSCFESALLTAFSDAWQSYLLDEEVNIPQWAKEHSKKLLESAKEELKEHNSAWSGEDSTYYDDICEILINLIHSETDKINKNAVQKDLDWLNSLKQRINND